MNAIIATNPIALLIVTCALATVSVTISRSTFTMFMRDWLDDKVPIIGKLLSCPYCVAHWIALPVSFVLFWDTGIFFALFYGFAVIGMATIIMGLMMKLFLWQEDEIKYLREQLHILKADKNVQERSENQAS